jgi:hypothetical protein
VVGDVVVRICTEDLPRSAEDARLPRGFDAWLRKAMARNPGARFQSAHELSRTLARALELDGGSSDLALADTQLEVRAAVDQSQVETLDRGTASPVPAREPGRASKVTRLLVAVAVAVSIVTLIFL